MLRIITFSSLSERFLIFSYFSEILSYNSVWNIFLCFLILSDSLCLYLLSGLATSPGLERVALYRRHPMGINSRVLPGCKRQVAQDCPL